MSKTFLYNKLNILVRTNEDIDNMIKYIKRRTIPITVKRKVEERAFIKRCDNFNVIGETLIYEPLKLKVVRPQDVVTKLKELYDDKTFSAGVGIEVFYKKIRSLYIGITREQAGEFLKNQEPYQLTKSSTHRTSKPIIATYPNQLYCIDLIDMNQFIEGKYRYILSVIDVFSRKCFLEAITQKTPKNIMNAFKNIIKNAIEPKYIICDNGTEFQGEFMDFCKENNITIRNTRSYSPQSNGIVERLNQEVRKILRDLMVREDSTKWVKLLKDVEDNKNNSYHSNLKYTPNEIWIKNKDKNVNETQMDASNNVKKNAQASARKFKETVEFKKGDLVRVKMSSLFSEIRKKVKSGDSKNIIVRYTPDIFVIDKVVYPRTGFLDRNRYILTLEGKRPSKGGSDVFFYASDLQKVSENTDTSNMSIERALKLDKVKRLADDIIF